MLNLDTHIVIRLVENTLSHAETEAIRSARLGVSAMVLWEISKLHQLERIGRGLEDPAVAALIRACHVWPLDAAVALASTRLDFRSDPADEIISATSVAHRVPLMTRDERILASKVVPFWA